VASTPLIYKALTDNDNLKEVLFEFWTAGSTGGIQKYLDIKLTNGRIVSSAMVMNPSLEGGGSTVKGAAQVGLVTQVIELTYETMSWKYQGFKTDGSTFGGPKEAEVKWGEM
jgi:type VI secretion system Hcp family effector